MKSKTLGSHYLAPINNHGEENKNAEYKSRIENLVNFVMVMFNQDQTVIPKESAFFEFYTLGQDVEVRVQVICNSFSIFINQGCTYGRLRPIQIYSCSQYDIEFKHIFES